MFRERDTEQLSTQIDTISQEIAAEKKQAAELELKARLYNFGKSKSVEEVCREVIHYLYIEANGFHFHLGKIYAK